MSAIKRRLRRLEGALRTRSLRLLGALVPPRSAASADPSRPRRVLFVRYDAIGDMVLSTGFLRRLKEAHPAAEIDVVASPMNAVVLEGNPHVSRVFIHRRGSVSDLVRAFRRLPARRYEAAVDGLALLPRVNVDTAVLMIASRAPRRVGAGGRVDDFIFTDRERPPARPGAHFIDVLATLARPFGIDPEVGDWRPSLALTGAERERAAAIWGEAGAARAAMGRGDGEVRLLVNLSAAHPRRRWPDERFAAVIDRARRADERLRVVILGAPSEWDSVRRVAADTGALAARTPGVRDAFALVAESDAVLTPDTSITHAASAFARPSVVLLPFDQAPFGPYGTLSYSIFSPDRLLESIPAEAVAEAVERMLRDLAANRVGAAT